MICALDVVLWALVAFATLLSRSDAATKGLDNAAGLAVTALFVSTVVPAFLLVMRRRAPRTALTLSLAFPAAFMVLFVVAIVAFA